MLAKLNAVSTGLTTAISKLITFISLENDRDVDALFKLADERMYAVKVSMKSTKK